MTKKISMCVIAAFLAVLFTGNLQAQNTLTEDEKKDGFVLLFDGKTSDGWRGYKKDYFPDKWIIEDGVIHFNPKAKGKGGDIVYDKEFSDFHLKIEWKIDTGGNSGIFYLGSEDEAYQSHLPDCPGDAGAG